jgi:TENA/THI-4/PQQC family protein
VTAAELVGRIRNDLREVEQRIAAHPWLAALEKAGVSREALAAFADEQLRIIASDLRSFEAMHARFPAAPDGPYLEAMAAGERAAIDALEAFAAAVGARRDEYEPVPACQAYPAYVARIARDGAPAEVAGAFLVNLEAWGSSCGRMHRALRDRYGLDANATRFFALFADPPADFEARSLEVIDAGMARGVDARAVARAARMLQEYELLYWDGLPS